MFGIGLPEMIVILAVALIVVGPDKLPDLARSVAKTILELKKTVNQVKNSLANEEELLGSVKSDLNKAAEDLKDNLQEADQFPLRELEKPRGEAESGDEKIIDGDDRQPEPGTTATETRPPEPDASPTEQNSDRDPTAEGDPDAAKK